jgi:hypothetical protein
VKRFICSGTATAAFCDLVCNAQFFQNRAAVKLISERTEVLEFHMVCPVQMYELLPVLYGERVPIEDHSHGALGSNDVE